MRYFINERGREVVCFAVHGNAACTLCIGSPARCSDDGGGRAPYVFTPLVLLGFFTLRAVIYSRTKAFAPGYL